MGLTLLIVAVNAAVVLGAVTLLWMLSVLKRDVSIVDPFWAPLFAIILGSTIAQTGWTPAKVLLCVMVCAWALRLGGYLVWRGWGEPEDFRYAGFRKHYGADRYWWFSFFQVFLLQAALGFVVSAPLQLAGAADAPDPIRVFDAVGAALFAVGFFFEAVGDYQLLRFKRSEANHGKLLTTGLWAWTRHPNYFGNAVMWWGFGVSAIDEGWGALALVGPLLMTFLLLRVSGVSMLDRHLKKTKPGFEDYVARTPAFFPKPPSK